MEELNGEIASLKSNEHTLLNDIDGLKAELSNVRSERKEFQEQNEKYQNELENIQKLLSSETEIGSKSAAKVMLLTRQLDEEQKRAMEATHQAEDFKMQLKSTMMTNDSLKIELNQARGLIQEHIAKVNRRISIEK